MKQTRQAVCAVKQSIFLGCLCLSLTQVAQQSVTKVTNMIFTNFVTPQAVAGHELLLNTGIGPLVNNASGSNPG